MVEVVEELFVGGNRLQLQQLNPTVSLGSEFSCWKIINSALQVAFQQSLLITFTYTNTQ